MMCIYCGTSVNIAAGEGDHVIPAALGEFTNGIRFRHICPSCNSRIGKSEQQMLRCGPERLFRDLVIPSTSRSRGSPTGWRGAEGAPAPKIHALAEDGVLLGRRSDKPTDITADDQLVVIDKNGKEHFVTLDPRMTAGSLKRKVQSTGVRDIKMVRSSWDESNEQAYLRILEEAWPDMKYQHVSTTQPGSNKVRVRVCFQVNDHYFRAIAKIAFHYYLTRSKRAKGHEDGFAQIRKFIVEGGDSDPFFKGRKMFAPMEANMLPSWWCHILAASEEVQPVVAYVCLFRGPQATGIEYTVKLGRLESALVVPQPVWAHAYEYARPVPSTGKAGTVRAIQVDKKFVYGGGSDG